MIEPNHVYSATVHNRHNQIIVPSAETKHCAYINSLRPRPNGHLFADDTFKRIFLNENVRISIKTSLKFVPKGPINNIPVLVQIMARRRPGDKPLSEPIIVYRRIYASLGLNELISYSKNIVLVNRI